MKSEVLDIKGTSSKDSVESDEVPSSLNEGHQKNIIDPSSEATSQKHEQAGRRIKKKTMKQINTLEFGGDKSVKLVVTNKAGSVPRNSSGKNKETRKETRKEPKETRKEPKEAKK